MYFKPVRRNFIAIVGICGCCLLFGYSVVVTSQSSEESVHYNGLIDYLLNEYKDTVLQKSALEKQKYFEVKKLKEELKEQAKELKKTTKNCTNIVNGLRGDVKGHVENLGKIMKLLDGTFSTMDRSSAVLVAVLKALQEAEEKVVSLEHQLALLTNATI